MPTRAAVLPRPINGPSRDASRACAEWSACFEHLQQHRAHARSTRARGRLGSSLGPGASAIKRSEHVLADANSLHRLIAGAGFRDVVPQTVTQTIRFTSP